MFKFSPNAKQIVQIYQEYQTMVIKTHLNATNTVTIGTIPVMAQYGITDTVLHYKRLYPDCNVKVIEAESADLKEMLKKGKCDLAFIRDTTETDDEFERLFFTNDILVAVFPRYSPFAERKTIALKSLQNENFIFVHPNTLMYEIGKNACLDAGFKPHVVFTAHRLENIIDLVSKGLGISLLMEQQANFYQTTKKFSTVTITPYIKNQISIYYPKKQPLSKASLLYLNSIISS